VQERLDILALEREFDRLRRFLAQEGLPLARAVAIARFAAALPDWFQGRAYYLAELSGDAREAFAPARAQTRDPRLLDLLLRAEETLEIAPAGGIAPRRARPEPDDPPGTEQQTPHPCPRFQSHVEVPLVQLLPETSLTPADPGAVGVIARVTVVPAAGVRGPRIEWHNRRAAEPAGDLRSLQDVGADALLAARQALRADEARATARDRIAARLERLLVGGDEARTRRLGFRLSLPEKSIPVAGDSIGLGLAVAFAGVLRGLLRRGHGFRPRADVAWTGRVLPSGRVLEVDPRTLETKIRAARSAGLRALVVPASMASSARAVAAAENCPLEIQGLDEVSAAIGRPEIVEPWRLPADLVESCTRRRLHLALQGAALAVLAVLLLYHIPPRPQRVAIDGPAMALRVQYQGLWPSRLLKLDAAPMFAALVGDLDGDAPGARRIVYATGRSGSTPRPGRLAVFDPVRWRPVWSDTIRTSGLPYEPRTLLTDGLYSTKVGWCGDLDGDGRAEILLAAALNPHAATFLWFYDGLRGRASGLYHHGHIEFLEVADLDRDGTPEIVLAGLHGPTRGISIAALHPDQMRPCDDAPPPLPRPEAPDWDPLRQPCLFHLVAPAMRGLEELHGRRDLGTIGRPSLDILDPPDSPRRISFAISVLDHPRPMTDYILTCDHDGWPIALTANAYFRDRVADLRRRGIARIDFGSDSLLAAWRGTFRTRPYIQNDWPDP